MCPNHDVIFWREKRNHGTVTCTSCHRKRDKAPCFVLFSEPTTHDSVPLERYLIVVSIVVFHVNLPDRASVLTWSAVEHVTKT
jgi:hypothetical protein